jgi:cell division protein FtsB
MNQSTHPKTKFKFVSRPGKPLMKAALLGVLVLSTAALIAIHSATASKEAGNSALEQQVMDLEDENRKLEQYNESKDTEEGIQQVAQGELGMVDPDTVIYDFE